MRTLLRYIEAKGGQFARHPFFSRVEHVETATHMKALASSLTFWIMSYQDMLRLNEDRIEDPVMRKLLRVHRTEEAGHDRWFLEDLTTLGVGLPDLRWVFGPNHTPARDASHALVGEVFRAKNDAERLALVLVCEATGATFFEKMDAHLRRQGLERGLKFFAGAHLEAEQAHTLFDDRMDEILQAFSLTPASRTSAFALVDRTFAAFSLLMDGMDVALVRAGVARRRVVSGDAPEASAA